ncbi:2-dehydro-3-deoxy-D-gluconate 5-dehydrogenase KduD [Jeotgalibacillus soli]|uniref:2-deoxy-D-gluconate 3-dehydrogenase n=1 Tax=Jeotgalibacillus soli TaxID=889306 RepID=A0A0C2W6C1_9BACL|nr:2-dehydro-3-deoxy-D-gluconate 5-dehydrogenase KduD [Jeotgalibacillus soli]KIL52121.1 2-deoxy-D-gluconate 3-dehydrogenase [Jeotgalibacillus soli]
MGNELHDLFSLQGKTAVITGASRGLGAGIAKGLAKAGADIIGVGISDMSSTQEEVERYGQTFTSIQMDISENGRPAQLKSEVLQQVDRVDIVVNNAGIIRRSAAEEYSDEDWSAVIQLNQNIVFQMCREFGKHMIDMGGGKIINIASMLSFQGGLRVPAYTASKHAVAGVTKSFANEWASRNVCVNAIAPGYMETDNTVPIREDEQRNSFITSRIPAGRWGKPEDLQGAAIFLASPASNYVSGHILCVDGGWMST